MPRTGDGSAFERPGSRGPVLLLHGFGGTPFEVRPLGEKLAAAGFAVAAPLLPGHGAGPDALARTTWPDWYEAAAAAADRIAPSRRPLAVAGLSMGGLLALRLAAERPQQVAAAVAMAAPLWLHWRADRLVRRLAAAGPVGSALVRMAVGLRAATGSDARDPKVRWGNPSTHGFSLPPLASLIDLMEEVRRCLDRVVSPLLIVHSRRDHTAPFACASTIAAGVRGPVERLDLERSFHLVSADVEHERVAAAVGAFLGRRPVPGRSSQGVA